MSSDAPLSPVSQPVTVLKGVGPRQAERLQTMGIHSVQDLLFHLPIRYEDRTRVAPIGSLRPGERVVVQGLVELKDVVFRRRRQMLCRISDGTGDLTLRFFYFNRRQEQSLTRGTRLRCFGEVRQGPAGLEMVHPEYRQLAEDQPVEVEETLTPVYSVTEGMRQNTVRGLVGKALARLGETVRVAELLPAGLLPDGAHGLDLVEALHYIHNPPPDASLAQLQAGEHPYQQRLAFEELLAHHLSLRQLRRDMQSHAAPALAVPAELWPRFLDGLGFALTHAQQRVIAEITDNLSRPMPMLRLVQGDVGSGKTVVAAAAALQAIEAGYQVALMAPTEILAEQHFRNFLCWMEALDVPIAWLSGKQKGKARGAALYTIASGEARLVVGTHALFQDEVEFHRLGLVIVDEQHRFGVHQRLRLMEKGQQSGFRPHQLVMTATPIPRTLAMISYADLDVSVIDELPPGRKPVTTVALSNERREEVKQRVEAACAEGRQVYWVCPLIDESEVLEAQAATQTWQELSEEYPALRVGLVHGRMKPAEKEMVMAQYKAGEIDLLVATTVIEVGVDVPNASLMIIENAERLGLFQLHQLRGRVGRGSEQSSCVLMYKPPLGQLARERLAVMRDSNDGFVIAQKDLEMRGPGEVLGTRQTGMADLLVADLVRDQPLMPKVAQAAEVILEQYPETIGPILRRWIRQRMQYANV